MSFLRRDCEKICARKIVEHYLFESKYKEYLVRVRIYMYAVKYVYVFRN